MNDASRNTLVALVTTLLGACDFPPGAAAIDASIAADTDVERVIDAAARPDGWVPTGSRDARFVDVTASLGIDFQNQFDPTVLVGSGLSWIDYDNDARPDLFIAGDYRASALYRNLGDGRFADVTAAAGLARCPLAIGSAVADVDNDGDADLYVLRWGAPDRLYINNGGVFTDEAAIRGLDATEKALGSVAAFADYDGDGWLDLFVGTYQDPHIEALPPEDAYRGELNRMYHGTGNGHFAEDLGSPVRTDDPTLAAAWTDYDNDGDVDLWVVNDAGMFYQGNRLFRNDGGRLVEVTNAVGAGARIFGMSAASGDPDNDGDIDMYCSNIMANTFHVQGPDGRFTDRARELGVAAHGFKDTLRGDPSYPAYDPSKSFEEAAMSTFMASYADPASLEWGATSWGAVFFDYDHDGWLDLYVANGFVNAVGLVPEGVEQPDMLFHGLGDGSFARTSGIAEAASVREARGVATADYDGDGDLDLAVGVSSIRGPRPSFVLRNDTGADAGYWLKVRLVGTRSNRDGFGARVLVTAGGLTRTAERFGGGSYASTSAPDLHFGLALSNQATVEIQWPSGLRDRFQHVEANRRLVAVEGTSPR